MRFNRIYLLSLTLAAGTMACRHDNDPGANNAGSLGGAGTAVSPDPSATTSDNAGPASADPGGTGQDTVGGANVERSGNATGGGGTPGDAYRNPNADPTTSGAGSQLTTGSYGTTGTQQQPMGGTGPLDSTGMATDAGVTPIPGDAGTAPGDAGMPRTPTPPRRVPAPAPAPAPGPGSGSGSAR